MMNSSMHLSDKASYTTYHISLSFFGLFFQELLILLSTADEVLDMEAYLKDYELEMDVKEYEKNSN